jgi:hypothetical protein
MVEKRGDQQMRKKKRRVVVVLFADRRIFYLAKVRVLATSKARNREILELFHGDQLPPFLDWKVWSDEPMTLSSERDPAIVATFGDEEPDMILEWGECGLKISDRASRT